MREKTRRVLRKEKVVVPVGGDSKDYLWGPITGRATPQPHGGLKYVCVPGGMVRFDMLMSGLLCWSSRDQKILLGLIPSEKSCCVHPPHLV
jgi:hypothetical protein